MKINYLIIGRDEWIEEARIYAAECNNPNGRFFFFPTSLFLHFSDEDCQQKWNLISENLKTLASSDWQIHLIGVYRGAGNLFTGDGSYSPSLRDALLECPQRQVYVGYIASINLQFDWRKKDEDDQKLLTPLFEEGEDHIKSVCTTPYASTSSARLPTLIPLDLTSSDLQDENKQEKINEAILVSETIEYLQANFLHENQNWKKLENPLTQPLKENVLKVIDEYTQSRPQKNWAFWRDETLTQLKCMLANFFKDRIEKSPSIREALNLLEKVEMLNFILKKLTNDKESKSHLIEVRDHTEIFNWVFDNWEKIKTGEVCSSASPDSFEKFADFSVAVSKKLAEFSETNSKEGRGKLGATVDAIKEIFMQELQGNQIQESPVLLFPGSIVYMSPSGAFY